MKIIGVAAGKGGVGKSTLSVNLALALQKMGQKVGLLDADLYGPSLATMVKVERAADETSSSLKPAYGLELPLMSLAFFRQKASVVRAPIANAIIEQLLQTEWGELDFLIVDFPPGTGDIQLTLLQQAPFSGVLLVTTPQRVSLIDVEKAAQMFNQMGVPILGIVENMSYLVSHPELAPFGAGGGERLAAFCKTPLWAKIPLDPLVCECADNGTSLFDGPSKTVPIFYRIAHSLKLSLEEQKPSQLEITLLSPNTLQIGGDQGAKQWRAADVQKMCPCILCRERPSTSDGEVTILSWGLIGNYALEFRFSQGCSHGLYPLSLFNTEVVS